MGRPLKWQTNPVMQRIVARNRQQKHQQDEPLHWLDLQKPERYTWQRGSPRTFYRRMGVVEGLFNADGAYWSGRADLHQNLHLEIKTTLTDNELRDRIIIAWTLMRHSHILLSCKAKYLHEVVSQQQNLRWTDMCFVYEWPESGSDAIASTKSQITFVADEHPNLDARDFYQHILNTERALDPGVSLSKLYVLPFQKTRRGTVFLHFMPIIAHQITDGLTTYQWNNHLMQILNTSGPELRQQLNQLLSDRQNMLKLLPPPQEALYPRRSENKARERWYWLITRILRHVHVPPPASFQNPLRREDPLQRATAFPPKYEKVLGYHQTPPLNGGNVNASLHGRSVKNMRRLCKEAGISIGSGLFTLVAMVMMEFEERREPGVPLEQRLPFVGSFPVNPRPFLAGESTTGKENSCMLAFSDGVTLPFLPMDLDFTGRFKVLGRLAHKQLRQYQKKRIPKEEVKLDSRSPSQLIPALFCSTLERMEGRADRESKTGINVQGSYPARVSPTFATCGISSVGDVSSIISFPPVDMNHLGSKDVVAELKDMASVVRPRDGEFLVGAIGSKDHVGFLVAYDATAIDPTKAAAWKEKIESLLDRELFEEIQAKL